MKSICCIDDHDRCRMGIVDLLTDLGFKAEGFATTEAFHASKQTFAKIILDLNLGEQCGLEFLAALRDAGDDTPVIIYSGSLAKIKLAEAVGFPELNYLVKPFKINELIAIL